MLQFMKLKMARKLVVRATTIDTHKQFIMTLEDSKVKRIEALIRAGLKKESGIHPRHAGTPRSSEQGPIYAKGFYRRRNTVRTFVSSPRRFTRSRVA